MTHRNDLFMLDQDACLDYATILEISNGGFSRIPVYDPFFAIFERFSRDNDVIGVVVFMSLM